MWAEIEKTCDPARKAVYVEPLPYPIGDIFLVPKAYCSRWLPNPGVTPLYLGHRQGV